ncbi:MAG: S8 family serine peptidase [Ferruginibacter sp.]
MFNKTLLRITLILLAAFLFPFLSNAQQPGDYSIRLHSGKFTPAENKKEPASLDEVLLKTAFLDKHYLVIQFYEIPSVALRQQLKSAGVELIDYVPNFAYTAAISKNFNRGVFANLPWRAIFLFNAGQKAMADVLQGKPHIHAVKQAGFVDMNIHSYQLVSKNDISQTLLTAGGILLEDVPVFRMFTLRIPQNKIHYILEQPWVQWAEFIDPPNQPENLPGRTLHRVNILQEGIRNLKGDGMNIGVWDEVASQHLDFSPSGRLTNVETGTAGSHGTHVSGTIGSKGIINPVARGMAPNASIFSYNGFNNDVQVEMATAIPAHTLISSNHSYHDGLGVQCGVSGASASYSLRARNTDLNLNNFAYHIHCHSSGNAQSSCTGGWGTITGTGKAAKNNLVVGNITSTETLSGSSSCGPVHDGRVKPEIVAMGTNVFSTYTPLNSYASITGTSMSTPGITGTVALLAQRYKQLNGNVLPPSMLIKNIVCNNAADLGNPGPDYRFGFGRINALRAVKTLEENRYVLNDVAQAAVRDVTIVVPAGAAKLNVMLTWNDPAATANVSQALVNNLDLFVTDGSNNHLPWILNPATPAAAATKAVDNISNIEQVTVENPAAGTYTLRVTGTAIASGPAQAYALSWTVDAAYIEVIYPNGTESFNPGSSETITWDNAGVTGTQTVEYSLDAGATWNTIGSVAANTTRMTWTVPAANTSTAIVRITSGSISDASDNNFKILNTVTGFSANGTSCNAGEVNFSWTAGANATHYDIYKLNPTTGDFDLLAGDIPGNTYTATGLTAGSVIWCMIRAKNAGTNAVSNRTNAISVTVSNGGGGIGAVGSITGNNAVCGVQNGIVYSIAAVSGASSYTWTVPAGASIVSGQGSTSITVNYGPGALSGNVSVAASNGSCQTVPAVLSITTGSASAAPVGGPSLTETICNGAAIPTLTASATVPSGFSLVWYDAATGGNVVANPVLNSVGTVTYYASSVENATGCQSSTRTAVSLTINAIPLPAVSAGGPLSFCSGGSVTLTSSQGTAFAWSNGAVTQSVTVNQSGNYTVTVTNSGCTNSTQPVIVTVNPLPDATVTAGSATSFCQGQTVTLTASAGNSWLWSNGAATQAVTISASGNYSVTVTDANGCTASSAASAVAVSPNPQVNITASPDRDLQPGITTELSANVTPAGNYLYTWYKDNVPVINGNQDKLIGIDIDELGSYTVTVENASGLPCRATSAAQVVKASPSSQLFIWPNPNSGLFNAAYYSAGANVYTFTVTDSKGALVYRKTSSISDPYQRTVINLRHHAKGLYIVALYDKSGKRIASSKVSVQ